MMIKDGLEVSDGIIASGGFGDIRSGVYRGRPIAVKTAKVTGQEKLRQIRKVSVESIPVFTWACS